MFIVKSLVVQIPYKAKYSWLMRLIVTYRNWLMSKFVLLLLAHHLMGVPLLDLLLCTGRSGLPPAPDTLQFGFSYHLHTSHHFPSTWGAVMLKRKKEGKNEKLKERKKEGRRKE